MTDEPLLRRKSARPRPAVAPWLARLLLAACLFFASEIVLWTDITRPLWAWPLVGLGYLGVAALLTELLLRYRVYELFGGLVLAGTYGLLASMLLNPAVAFAGLPISLVTRVMGAQTAAGALGLALYLGLIGGGRRGRLLTGAALVGAFWGVWVRGTPIILGVPEAATALPLMLTWGAATGAIVISLALLVARVPTTAAAALILTRIEWGIVTLLLGAVTVLQSIQGLITRDVLSYVVVLVFFCIMILWFQHQRENPTLLMSRTPPTSPPPLDLVLALVVWLAVGALAHQLPPPQNDTLGLLQLATVAFGGFGLAWLPAVCVVLGVRAYRHTSRTGKSL